MSQDYVCGIVDDIFARDTASGQFWNIKVNGQSFGWGKYPPKFGPGSEIEFDIQWRGEYANVNWDSVNVLNQVGNGPQQGGGGGRGSGRAQGGGQQGGGYNRGGQGGGQRQQGGGYGGGQRQGGGAPQGGGYGGHQRQAAPAQRQQAPQQRQAAGGPAGKDDYWARKEERDVDVQKAIQYQASRNAAIAALDSMLTVEAVKLPAKQADKYDAYLALLEELTDHFNKQTSSLGNAAQGKQQAQQQQDDNDQDKFDDDGMPEYQPED